MIIPPGKLRPVPLHIGVSEFTALSAKLVFEVEWPVFVLLTRVQRLAAHPFLEVVISPGEIRLNQLTKSIQVGGNRSLKRDIHDFDKLEVVPVNSLPGPGVHRLSVVEKVSPGFSD